MRLVLALALALPVSAQTITRVSVSSTGAEGNGPTTAVTISESGRWVAMQSSATNLVAGDTNGADDVFLHDRNWGTTTRISVATGGAEANGASGTPSMSGSGERIAFESTATNLVGGYGPTQQIYVHDRLAGTTVGASAVAGNDASSQPQISLDGQWVVFQSDATNLVAGDTNGATDVFLAEVATGATTRLSVSSGGGEANGPSTRPTVSADGRWVTFGSSASNLVPGDTNGVDDVFLHDTLTGQTTRVSTTSAGLQASGATVAGAISPDGGFVGLASDASNLVFGDTNGARDIFVKVLGSGLVVRVSVSSSGVQGSGNSFTPGLSWYGSEVSFHSLASLAPGDTNGARDVYRHDLDSGTTTLLSATASGMSASGTSWLADLDTGGRVTVFQSDAPDLVAGDTNGVSDAFVQLQKATWYIDVAGAGSGTGTPGNPYTSIQYAIDRPQTVGGDELLVAAGTYYENVDLAGKAVELASISGPHVTTIDGQGQGTVITAVAGEGPGTAIRGLTITAGSGTWVGPNTFGGGIYCVASDLAIDGCWVTGNSTFNSGANEDKGGGIHAEMSALSLENSVVSENTSSDGYGISIVDSKLVMTSTEVRDHVAQGFFWDNEGVGLYAVGASQVSIDDCLFEGNRPVPGGSSGAGAAIYSLADSLDVSSCQFLNNGTGNGSITGYEGGAIAHSGGPLLIEGSSFVGNRSDSWGGALYLYSPSITIRDSDFVQNLALISGGAIYTGGSNVTLEGCRLSGNFLDFEGHDGGALYSNGDSLSVDDCLFEGNLGYQGGAVRLIGTDAIFQDTRFERNIAVAYSPSRGDSHGGALNLSGGQVQLWHCTLRDNFVEPYNQQDGHAIYGPATLDRCTVVTDGAFPSFSSGLVDVTVKNSIVRNAGQVELGGASTSAHSNIQGGWPGTGNIDEDPLFWDAEGGDFHLRAGSPCIDAGDPTSPLDPDGSLADMGAFPFDPDYCPPVTSYCTAGTTGNGCTATISATGTPSATAASGFNVSVTSVEGQKQGIIFWGLVGKAAPWGGGTSYLCVQAPAKRTGTQDSGGTAGLCDGSFSLDFNAWMAANPGKAPGLGKVIYMQAWFRDPPSPKTTSLSDGLRFVVCE